MTGDIDPTAVEDLIAACVRYHRVRAEAAADHAGAAAVPSSRPGPPTAPQRRSWSRAPSRAPKPTGWAQLLAMLEHQILANVIQVVSGPGGVASLLRRNLLGKGLNGPPCRWTSARPTTSGSTCGAW